MPTSFPVLPESSQPLPTLLKIPLLKSQPLNDVVSSVLLRRLGETLNTPTQKEISSDVRSRVLTEALLPRTNLQPSQPKTNDLNNLLLVQALEGYSVSRAENRSFFEKLAGKKKQWNCGKGFDIYKLLDVVQRSRERAENLTQYYSLSTTTSDSTKRTGTSQAPESKTDEHLDSLNHQAINPMAGEMPGGYQGQVPPAEAFSPSPQVNFPFEQMQVRPTTILYRQFQSLVKFPIHKVPPLPDEVAPISSAALSQGTDYLLQQPKENKPPMLIPIFEKSYFPHPVNSLPKATDKKTSRFGGEELNDGMANGYPNFKNYLSQKSRM
ncbi:hypothetical protein GE061_010912 [Apolygus lucorum]|uniref:Uncharacterized protein n=1 Tax=Apolygus lucorum TaxID=248454 RepID=A0A8S9XYM4_APOLU|nr:hypothetical protein GE061_010912 [Apolygus lucorum]